MEIRTEAPLMIPPGGSSEVSVSYRSRMEFDNFIAQLKEPAEGISVSGVTISQGSLSFTIKADASKVKPGFADNVIVEIFSVMPVGKPDADAGRKTLPGMAAKAVFDVTTATTTVFRRLRLKGSSWITTTGRRLAGRLPTAGPRSHQTMSPRLTIRRRP